MVTGAIEAPKRLEDLHVRRDLVASLLLRTLAFADQLTGAALEQRLGLPFETFSPLIDEFEKNQLMDTRGVSNDPCLEGRPYPVNMNYAISGAGRQRAAEMSAVQTRYLGPCPVNFEDYLALIRSQVSGKSPVTDAQLKKALGELELEQHVIDQIGGAMVSRASLFIFGAPGNGKSTITERMALLMGAPIEIPHAVALGDEIVRVIDPVYHKIAEGEQPVDRRLVKVERPVVTAAVEGERRRVRDRRLRPPGSAADAAPQPLHRADGEEDRLPRPVGVRPQDRAAVPVPGRVLDQPVAHRAGRRSLSPPHGLQDRHRQPDARGLRPHPSLRVRPPGRAVRRKGDRLPAQQPLRQEAAPRLASPRPGGAPGRPCQLPPAAAPAHPPVAQGSI